MPGRYYKVLQYGWDRGPEPVYEEVLGVFVRSCPEIPDWYTEVLEFRKDDSVVHFRIRPIHKLIEYTNRYFMEKAEERMFAIYDGVNLKQQIVLSKSPSHLYEF